jgi:lactococcin 972 family bacteriocin
MGFKKVASVLAPFGLAGVLAVGGMSAANAATSYPDGGTFDYGVDYGYMTVWANYFHGSKSHGSTACNRSSCTRSDRADANRWSFSDRTATWGGNSSYYWF